LNDLLLLLLLFTWAMTSVSTLIFFVIAKQSKKRMADAEDRAQAAEAQLHVLVQREIARQQARQTGRTELAKMYQLLGLPQPNVADQSHE